MEIKYKCWQLLSALLLLTACGTDFNKPYSDTPTSGKVRIGGDETLEGLLNTSATTFMGLYRYAELTVSRKPESDCFMDLLNDSVKAVLVTRRMNKSEEDYFNSRKLYPVTTRVAVDGLAIIVNRKNRDTLLHIDQLQKILSGEIQDWKSINPASTLGKLNFVFDNKGSSTVRYLIDSLKSGSSDFPSNCFAARSNPEVISYVEANPGAIGVIGVNWISDKDDPKMLSFSRRIKVVWMTTAPSPVYPDDYFGPYQAYLFTNQYPLRREVFIINREGRNGLATGFSAFLAGEQGQRIVRMAGLLPASPYTRDIRLN